MSMTIGGNDVILTFPRHSFNVARLLESVQSAWPDAVMEDAAEGPLVQVREVLAGSTPWRESEFFIYRDRLSAEIWTAEGYSEANRGRMLHVLIVERTPQEIELTLVIDEVSPQTRALVEGIAQAMSVENGAIEAREKATRRSP